MTPTKVMNAPCAKCLKFPRLPGDAMCWGCADIERQVAAAWRRDDPIQK